MRKPVKVILWIVGIFFGIIGLTVAIALYHTSPEREAKIKAEQEAKARYKAAFDSLSRHYLQQLIDESPMFSNAEYDANRHSWTLTVGSNDWYLIDEGTKKDVAGTIYIGLRKVIAQIGGDPRDARVVLQDKWGERLAVCSDFYGVKIDK